MNRTTPYGKETLPILVLDANPEFETNPQRLDGMIQAILSFMESANGNPPVSHTYFSFFVRRRLVRCLAQSPSCRLVQSLPVSPMCLVISSVNNVRG